MKKSNKLRIIYGFLGITWIGPFLYWIYRREKGFDDTFGLVIMGTFLQWLYGLYGILLEI